MSPSSLMSFAELFTPVEGRRSTIPEPSFHRNARLRPKLSRLVPTTWPRRFTAFAWLTAPPSVPSSQMDASVDAATGERWDALTRRACGRAACWPTFPPAPPSRRWVPRIAGPDAGATIPADGDHVQDRRLALDRSVL